MEGVNGRGWMEVRGKDISADLNVREAATVDIVVARCIIFGSRRTVHSHGGRLEEWRYEGTEREVSHEQKYGQ